MNKLDIMGITMGIMYPEDQVLTMGEYEYLKINEYYKIPIRPGPNRGLQLCMLYRLATGPL